MIPGLAFFYGGMNRSKSVLNMLMMVVGALFIVGILWAIFGYSMAYGSTAGYFVGSFTDYFGLEAALAPPGEGDAFPTMVDVVFQAMFACLTVALIAGALADRMKFGAWIIFAAVWASLVYFPVAHWVWGGGWIGELSIGDAGVIDFAGGTAVHINAGAAALAVCIILGKRRGWPKTPMRPHNLTRSCSAPVCCGSMVRLQRGFGVRSRQHRSNRSDKHFVGDLRRWSCVADCGEDP